MKIAKGSLCPKVAKYEEVSHISAQRVALGNRAHPEWADHNGHMSAPFYAVAFGHANEQAMEELGLSRAYRARTGNALYVVEALYTYRRALSGGENYRMSTWLGGADGKRLSFTHRMTRDDWHPAAEAEILFVHVDCTGQRVVPFGPDHIARLASLAALAHLRSPAA